MGFRNIKAAAWVLGLVCALGSLPLLAQEEDPLIEMVVGLLKDTDRTMRGVGLQQVREEIAGEAATKKFAALLPDLSPDAQAGLLEALGDRGDQAARPAVLDMLDDKREEAVRAAALKSLGALGGAADVPLLAAKAATGEKLEKGAARLSLVRLRGEDVNQAIVSAMAEGEPGVRVELLGVLAARGAKETLPEVIAGAEDPEPAVRLAALGALRYLADESQTATVVKILKDAKDDAQRGKAELALLVVCSRGGQTCADPIIAGLADADPPARVALLHTLARAGGEKALAEIVARVEDDDEVVGDGAVGDEAVRMLSIWPDVAAVEPLRAVARKKQSTRHLALAIRGLVRLASPQADKPADLKILAEAMSLAGSPQERRMVLGVLGGVATAESLALAASALDESDLAEEAGLAVVMIAEKMAKGDQQKARSALEKVLKVTKNAKIRERAQKVLDSL